MTLVVLKLGGSLMHSEELPFWLNNIFSYPKKSTCIVVPGGGKFADQIRVSQKYFNFSDEIAHKMALLAMSQYGYFLTGINKSINIIKNFYTQIPILGVCLGHQAIGEAFGCTIKKHSQLVGFSVITYINTFPPASHII